MNRSARHLLLLSTSLAAFSFTALLHASHATTCLVELELNTLRSSRTSPINDFFLSSPSSKPPFHPLYKFETSRSPGKGIFQKRIPRNLQPSPSLPPALLPLPKAPPLPIRSQEEKALFKETRKDNSPLEKHEAARFHHWYYEDFLSENNLRLKVRDMSLNSRTAIIEFLSENRFPRPGDAFRDDLPRLIERDLAETLETLWEFKKLYNNPVTPCNALYEVVRKMSSDHSYQVNITPAVLMILSDDPNPPHIQRAQDLQRMLEADIEAKPFKLSYFNASISNEKLRAHVRQMTPGARDIAIDFATIHKRPVPHTPDLRKDLTDLIEEDIWQDSVDKATFNLLYEQDSLPLDLFLKELNQMATSTRGDILESLERGAHSQKSAFFMGLIANDLISRGLEKLLLNRYIKDMQQREKKEIRDQRRTAAALPLLKKPVAFQGSSNPAVSYPQENVIPAGSTLDGIHSFHSHFN